VAAAAAAAAAARRRLLQSEEEQLTGYSTVDLQHDWQFKIVRANRGVFRKPAALLDVIEQEARAGWVFLEKFDDFRVRFKRPATAVVNDRQMIAKGVDPYRTHYGISPGAYGLIVLLIGLSFSALLVAGIFAFIFALDHRH